VDPSLAAGAAVEGLALQAWVGFLRAHAALVETLQRELEAETGLQLTWYDVLVQLEGAPEGRLRMQELAAAVVLSKSGLTRVVDRMESAGLVERRSCPSDRRGTFAELTDAGRTALVRARPVHLRGVREHFGERLSERELTSMLGAADRLLAALGQPAAGSCPG
jgi:DNA-binding MarR family transcriptional regulator